MALICDIDARRPRSEIEGIINFLVSIATLILIASSQVTREKRAMPAFAAAAVRE
jgi:hypothetical protein